MKQVIAILPPHRLEPVETALHQIDHLPGFTLFQACGHSRGKGPNHAFAGTEWNPGANDQIVLMMFCSDEHLSTIVNAIRTAAYTGNSHNGLIAVCDMEGVVRIRTGESDDSAL
jgi:nitrogen regulatory protein P-II 1